MNLQEALGKYKTTLQKSDDFHIYLTNACYDHCAHCYMSTVSLNSSKTRYLDKDDLLHFIDLMSQDKSKDDFIKLGLSGGEPLLHPDIVLILDSLSGKGYVEVLTSGFALSSRNTKNRPEILEALVKNNIDCLVASPDEPYHSITWGDVGEVRKYIKQQGFSPRKLGYPSKTAQIAQKIGLAFIPIAGWLVLGLHFFSDKFAKGDNRPPALAIGRAKNLPDELQRKITKPLKIFKDPITISYDGKIQYSFYSCHDGFMNISELRDINDKGKATEFILERAANDITFQDMAHHDEWFFSDKVRKNNESK